MQNGIESVAGSREIGGLFETLVYLRLRILCSLMTPQARISYWRTTKGHEVDFVLKHGRAVVAIEVMFATLALDLTEFVEDVREIFRRADAGVGGILGMLCAC